MKITFDNREEVLKQLPKKSCVRFAVFCAERVQHLNTDSRVQAAIDAAKKYLEDPSKENADAAYHAANAADVVAYNVTDAAYHTARAAAYAANAAYYAAAAGTYAIHTVSEIASYAARAANDADSSIKQEIVNFLKELYIETLPEEQQNCWLVKAAL